MSQEVLFQNSSDAATPGQTENPKTRKKGDRRFGDHIDTDLGSQSGLIGTEVTIGAEDKINGVTSGQCQAGQVEGSVCLRQDIGGSLCGCTTSDRKQLRGIQPNANVDRLCGCTTTDDELTKASVNSTSAGFEARIIPDRVADDEKLVSISNLARVKQKVGADHATIRIAITENFELGTGGNCCGSIGAIDCGSTSS